MNWRALGVGLVVVLATTLAGFAAVPLLFVSGLFGGAITGYLAGGIRSGLVHGLILGIVVAVLDAWVGWWILTSNSQVYPGAGMILFFWWVLAVFIGAEVVLGSLVGGGLYRYRAG